jgi:hypothetical protein
MNKILIYIFLFLTFGIFSQKEAPSLDNFQKKYSYQKSKNYKGPTNTNYGQPATIEEKENPASNSNTSKNKSTINYSPNQIQKNRSQKQNSSQGSGSGNGYNPGNGGNKPNDPEMGKPQPIEFDTPEFDAPDLDFPDVDPPTISSTFWKGLMIIIIAALVIFLVYYLIKNHKPKNQKVIPPINENDWNPDLMTKSELELRLEEALLREDFRECVRIYFTFILKEMIRLKRIHWKKDLTNYDYILQAKSTKNYLAFEESVRIYDLVWYGEYEISRKDYTQLSIHLEKHYKELTQEIK